jgi:hypothetical protein
MKTEYAERKQNIQKNHNIQKKTEYTYTLYFNAMCDAATADENIRQVPPMISNYFPAVCDGRRGLLLYQQD